MKFAKNSAGKLLFQRNEWRTATLISSFFSRLAAEQRKRPSEQAREPEEQSEDDAENWERENDLTQMRKAVYQEIYLPNPLEYEGDNLCDLHKRNKFQTMIQDQVSVTHLQAF